MTKRNPLASYRLHHPALCSIHPSFCDTTLVCCVDVPARQQPEPVQQTPLSSTAITSEHAPERHPSQSKPRLIGRNQPLAGTALPHTSFFILPRTSRSSCQNPPQKAESGCRYNCPRSTKKPPEGLKTPGRPSAGASEGRVLRYRGGLRREIV